jgi:hypothetical protein
MAMIFRVLVGLTGLASLLTAAQHWFALDAVKAERGIEALGTIGAANIRADVGGIFIAIGIFLIMAAWRQSRAWLLGGLIIVGSALLGRFISLAIDGASERVFEPIIVEAIVIAILVGARWAWGRKAPEGL